MGCSHTVLGLGSPQLSEGSRESRGLSIRYSQREERPAGKTPAGSCAQGTPLGLREGLEPTRPFLFLCFIPASYQTFLWEVRGGLREGARCRGRQPFSEDTASMVLHSSLPQWKPVNECQCHWGEIGIEGSLLYEGCLGRSLCFCCPEQLGFRVVSAKPRGKAGKKTGCCGRAPNLSQDDEAVTGHSDSKGEGEHHIVYFQRK